MARLRYPGDMRGKLPKVLGGRFLVGEASYDEENDQTYVEVQPLTDPLKAAGLT